MVDFDAAISFVRQHGDEVERARLRYLLHGEVPTLESVASLLAGQRSDGGWAPFWSPDYGSLDATCYRLAQIEQLGITNAPAVARAGQFLEKRQRDDGSWEEDDSVKAQAPPWAVPGDPAAKLYLTANCGYWLVMLQGPRGAVDRAANLLDEQVQPHGQLPTFPHAHWLAAGFLYAAGHTMTAMAIICHLERNLVAMLPASNLAWLLVTLLGAGVPPQHSIVKQASSQLEHMQQADGRWVSEDGPDRDVHATLEALRALQLSGLGVSTN